MLGSQARVGAESEGGASLLGHIRESHRDVISFEELLQRAPCVLDKSLPLRRWHNETLFSAEARTMGRPGRQTHALTSWMR